jgi:hypothetical protein
LYKTISNALQQANLSTKSVTTRNATQQALFKRLETINNVPLQAISQANSGTITEKKQAFSSTNFGASSNT